MRCLFAQRQRTRILLYNWSMFKLIFIGSRDWTFLLSILETIRYLHFQFSRLLVMSLIVLDIVELAEKNVVKELGVYIDGQVFGYFFNALKTNT